MENPILSNLEYEKALSIFKKRQEYNKTYYAKKKAAREEDKEMGRIPIKPEKIDEKAASYILQQYKNKSLRRRNLTNDVANLRKTIEELQQKLNEMVKEENPEDISR